MCSYSDLQRRLLLINLIEHRNKGNVQQIQTITIYDRMRVQFPLQHVKAWDGSYGKLQVSCKVYYANMPELVQGEALKMPCVRTRGFESHC